MKSRTLRSEIRSAIRVAAIATTVLAPTTFAFGDDATPSGNPQGAEGGVSIRLLLAPSHDAVESKPVLPEKMVLLARKPQTGPSGLAPRPTIESLSPDPLALDVSLDPKPIGTQSKTNSVSLPIKNAVQDNALSQMDAGAEANSATSPDNVERLASKPRLLPTTPSGKKQSRPKLQAADPAPMPPSLAEPLRGNAPAKTAEKSQSKLAEVQPTQPSDSAAQLERLRELVAGTTPGGEPTRVQQLLLDALAEDKTIAGHHLDDGELAECPGSPEGKSLEHRSQPDDIPLEQDAHPYDAPHANAPASLPRGNVREIVQAPNQNYTAREMEIQRGINQVLSYFIEHPENVVRRGPWALMHATLPFGVEAEIVAGNRRVNAIGWMCFNGVCAKQRMFQPTRTGFRTNNGPGVQGHEGQFLAILAQSHVSSDYPLKIGKKKYTVQDLVRYEMATCREKSELTFKLIGLSNYLPGQQRWKDRRGHTWNLEKMVAEELAQPIVGAACGGTHRLMGLSYALHKHQQAGLPTTGSWQKARQYINDYVNFAMSLQNRDGSFSTDWFEGRGMDRDTQRRAQTTGHILEWLIFTLPEEHLRSPQIQKSVEFLITTMNSDLSHDWPIGPRGHTLRALALYNQRVFGAEVGRMQEHIAGQQRVTVQR